MEYLYIRNMLNDKIINKVLEINDGLSDILNELNEHPNIGTLDNGLVLRKLKTVILKNGDTSKNVFKYLNKLLKSLNKRDIIINNIMDEYIDEYEEKSIISNKTYKKEKSILQIELLKMQEWCKTTGKTVVIVFEGRDTAGKGCTIRKMTQYLDPKYYEIVTKGVPSNYEKRYWFKRYSKHIKSGKIVFYDRSWYNRAIVEQVMGYSSKLSYKNFMKKVNAFEESLIEDDNIILIKIWLSITKETQKRRFDIRQNSPLKYWKYSVNDESSLEKWDDYTKYKEKVFNHASKIKWNIIDSNDKHVSGLNAMRVVLSEVEYTDKEEGLIGDPYPEVVTTINYK